MNAYIFLLNPDAGATPPPPKKKHIKNKIILTLSHFNEKLTKYKNIKTCLMETRYN